MGDYSESNLMRKCVDNQVAHDDSQVSESIVANPRSDFSLYLHLKTELSRIVRPHFIVLAVLVSMCWGLTHDDRKGVP